MNQPPYTTRHFLTAIAGAAVTLFTPSHCWAAGQPVLPWDYTLDVMQNFVAGPFAQSVIVLSGIAAVLTFALAGDNELVRRLAKAVIGTGVALIAVRLLNYLAP
jgi:type IV secretory pathway VirB2 component (pilin)